MVLSILVPHIPLFVPEACLRCLQLFLCLRDDIFDPLTHKGQIYVCEKDLSRTREVKLKLNDLSHETRKPVTEATLARVTIMFLRLISLEMGNVSARLIPLM